MTHHSSTHHPEPTGMTEPDHVDVRAILGYGAGLALVAALAHGAMLLMFGSMERSVDASYPPKVYPQAVSQDELRPPEPRLQGGVDSIAGRLVDDPPDHTDGPREALTNLRREEDQVLEGYAWVDRNAQVVRIPIEQAMKLTLERGLPARGAAPAEAPAEPATQEQGKEESK